VDAPAADGAKAGRAEQPGELAIAEEPQGAVAGIGQAEAVACVERAPGLAGRDAVAERVAGQRAAEGPGQVEARTMLAVEPQAAARPQHATQHHDRPAPVVDGRD